MNTWFEFTQQYGSGAWVREARRVARAAAQHSITIDPETLVLQDVRDLQALHRRLRQPTLPAGGDRGNRSCGMHQLEACYKRC